MTRLPLSLPPGQYVPGSSVLHRLDPRLKLLGSLVFVAGLFAVKGWAGLLILAAGATVTFLLARLPGAYLWRAVRPMVLILGATFVLQLFAYPGTPLLHLGPLVITREALEQSTFLTVRLGLLLVAGGLLTSTTSPVSLLAAMDWSLGPLSRVGLPGHEFALTMSLALRFIPTLFRQLDDLLKAQRTRGISLRSRDPRRVARALFPLVVPLFVQGFRQAERLSTAMLSRGYRGGAARSRYRPLHIAFCDKVALVAGGAWLTVALTAGRLWGW